MASILINKLNAKILGAAVIVTIGAVTILNSIRPAITVEANIECEQVNFDVIINDDVPGSKPILSSSLWAERISITECDRLTFRVPPAYQVTAFTPPNRGREIRIAPASRSSRIEIRSGLDAFSVRDILVGDGARVSWKIAEGNQRVDLRCEEDQAELLAIIATSDSLYLTLLDCAFVDGEGNTLHRTSTSTVEHFAFPVSFAKRKAIATSRSGRLRLDVVTQPISSEESVTLMRDIRVANVDYITSEYTPSGDTRERNTIASGQVRRPAYGHDDSFPIQRGDYVHAKPQQALLQSLHAGTALLVTSLVYDVQSLKVGAFESARHELVKSKLDSIKSSPTLVVIYTASLALFGLLTRLVLDRRKES